MTLIKAILFFLCIGIICSCSKEPSVTDILSLDTTFDLRLIQSLEAPNSTPQIYIATSEHNHCEDSELIYDNTGIQNKIEIHGVNTKTDCESPVFRAEATINLTASDNSLWEFDIDVVDVELTNGTIERLDSSFVIKSNFSNGVEFLNSEIQFLPENHLIIYAIKNGSSTGTDFVQFDILPDWAESLGEVSDVIKPTQDYGLFIVNNEVSIFSPISERYGYILKIDISQLESIKAELDAIRADNLDLEITAVTTSGREI